METQNLKLSRDYFLYEQCTSFYQLTKCHQNLQSVSDELYYSNFWILWECRQYKELTV